MKMLFLCQKLCNSGLEIVPQFNSYFLLLDVGEFLTKSSQILYYCSPPMFEGEGLISILKIWV